MESRRPQKPSITLRDSFFDYDSNHDRPEKSPPLEHGALFIPPGCGSSTPTTPTSPTFSAPAHRHSRSWSSGTSLSLTVGTPETQAQEPYSSTGPGKRSTSNAPCLPDVAEHPLELDSSSPHFRAPADDPNRGEPSDFHMSQVPNYYIEAHSGRESGIFSDDDAPCQGQVKRRRSDEPARRSISERVKARLPSFRRSRHYRSSTAMSAPVSALTSPTGGRSRSSSRARSLFRRSTDAPEPRPVNLCDLTNDISTISEDWDMRNYADDEEERRNSKEQVPRASTPLLSFRLDSQVEEEPRQSVMVEPTVCPDHQLAAMTITSPGMFSKPGEVVSPVLSGRPSMSGAYQSHRTSQARSSSEMGPSSEDESEEVKWSNRLGHADFHILPVPYLPEEYTHATCLQLLNAWDDARKKFTKHKCTTGMDFGPDSKTFRLTNEKWDWIESLWKANYATARNRAMLRAIDLKFMAAEPPPIPEMPDLDNLKSFMPGDGGIVGPMQKSHHAPLGGRRQGRTESKTESKRASLMQKFGIGKRGRSSSTT